MIDQEDVSLAQASGSEHVAASRIRTLAVWFLIVQGVGVVAWWLVLLLYPPARSPFMVPGAPDATLLAFLVADLLLYAGGSFVAAYGLGRGRPWGWPALCVNTGAAAYATLYGLALPLVSGAGWLGAVMMAPSLVVLPILVWRLRPGSSP